MAGHSNWEIRITGIFSYLRGKDGMTKNKNDYECYTGNTGNDTGRGSFCVPDPEGNSDRKDTPVNGVKIDLTESITR